MDAAWKDTLWGQFGAAIDMLENAIVACPDKLWSDRTRQPEYWNAAYHALFFLDLYLSGSLEGFQPPPPFTLGEPDRAYTKDEIRKYLDHCRRKGRDTIGSLTDKRAREQCQFPWLTIEFGELFLYNMRHVQHHAAQLNLLLRQTVDSAPRWVKRAPA